MSISSQSYTYDGYYTVPPYLLDGSIAIGVAGGRGGAGYDLGGTVAGGSIVRGSLAAASGDSLSIFVGSNGYYGGTGATGAGYHYGGDGGHADSSYSGGSGGGSTAIVSSAGLEIEAGGGGGSGGYGDGGPNGPGNTIAPSGGAGGSSGANGNGQGGYGAFGNYAVGGGAGTGASSTADGVGGSGGTYGGGNSGTAGNNGSTSGLQHVASGGAGGASTLTFIGDPVSGGGGGGGGGGGWWGGGGGGGGAYTGSGGGGGGGSDFASTRVLAPLFYPGASTVVGSATISARVADAPGPPTLGYPLASSLVDTQNQGVVFTFAPNPGPDSGPMTGYALRVTYPLGTYYWNATTGKFQPSEVFNTCSPTTRQVVVPANILPDQIAYAWSMATQESHFSLTGPYATPIAFQGALPPTVVVTTPALNTVYDEPICAVGWTETLATSAVQTSYRIRIFTTDVVNAPGFNPTTSNLGSYDSLVVAGTATFVYAGPLPNGYSYVAYVQITETGGISSIFTPSAVFSISYDLPQKPNFSATSLVDQVTGCPRVSLHTVSNDNLMDGGDTSFESDQGPITWTQTGTSSAGPDPTAWTNRDRGTSYKMTASGTSVVARSHCVGFGLAGIPAAPGNILLTTGTFSGSTSDSVQLQLVYTDSLGGVQTINVPGGLASASLTAAGVAVSGSHAVPATLSTGHAPVKVDLGFTLTTASGRVTYCDKMGIWENVLVFGWSAGGYAVTGKAEFQYSDDNKTWVDVTGCSSIPLFLTSSLPAYDNEAPLGGLRYYRARIVGNTGSGSAPGLWANTIALVTPVQNWWVQDALSQTADIYGNPWAVTAYRAGGSSAAGTNISTAVTLSVTQSEQQSIVRPLGRTNPVIVRGDLYGEEFSLSLVFLDKNSWLEFDALRKRRSTYCIRSDMGDVYYVAFGPDRPHDIFKTPGRLNAEGYISQVTVHCYPQDKPV